MVILVTVPVLAAAVILLYRYLDTRRSAQSLWRSSVAIGLVAGILRAALACVGWYGVEHTGGPLQVPAFALALLALPEAIVFGRHRGSAPTSFYASLALLIVVSSMLVVGAVGLAVQIRKWKARLS